MRVIVRLTFLLIIPALCAPAVRPPAERARGIIDATTIFTSNCFIIEKDGRVSACPTDKKALLPLGATKYMPCAVAEPTGTRPCTTLELFKSYNDALDAQEERNTPKFDGYNFGLKTRPIIRSL